MISALMEKTTLSKVKPTAVFPPNSPETESGDTDLINCSLTNLKGLLSLAGFLPLWSFLDDLYLISSMTIVINGTFHQRVHTCSEGVLNRGYPQHFFPILYKGLYPKPRTTSMYLSQSPILFSAMVGEILLVSSM